MEEAIKTCMNEKNLSRKEAIQYIREQCDGKTLAKLADEYNYMKYTKRCSSLWAPTRGIIDSQLLEYLRKAATFLQATADLYSGFNAKLRDWGEIPKKFRLLSREEKSKKRKELIGRAEKGEVSIDKPLSLALDTCKQMDEIKEKAMKLSVPEKCDLIHPYLISTISYFESSISHLAKVLESGDQNLLNCALEHASIAIKYMEKTTQLLEEAKT